MTEQDLLAQLRDVHLPAEPGWWPPAIGWWLVAGVLAALLVAWMLWLRRWRANSWRRAALREHQILRTGEPTVETVQKLSVLMRRVAMKVEPRQRVASVTDRDWLMTLDRIGMTTDYSDGVGRVLIDWPYQNLRSGEVPAQDLSRLFSLTESTIRRSKPKAERVVAGRQALAGEPNV